MDKITKAAQDTGEMLSSSAQQAGEAVGKFADDYKLKEHMAATKASAGDAVSTLSEKTSDAASSAAEGATSAVDATKASAGDAASKVSEKASATAPSAPETAASAIGKVERSAK